MANKRISAETAGRSKKPTSKAKKRKKDSTSFVTRFFVLCFVLVFSITLIQMQVELENRKRELSALEEQTVEQQDKNDELKRLLSIGGSEKYIEEMARDKLGFVYPDERVFIDISGS